MALMHLLKLRAFLIFNRSAFYPLYFELQASAVLSRLFYNNKPLSGRCPTGEQKANIGVLVLPGRRLQLLFFLEEFNKDRY